MQSDTEKYKALKKAIFDKLTYVTKRMGEAEDNESLAGYCIAWRHIRDILTEDNLDKEYMEYCRERRKEKEK